MTPLNLETLLAPIDQDHPCGPSLVYELEYAEIERLAKGTPEQQMGDSIKPAEDPDWKSVRDIGVKLLGQTKDLNLDALLCVALLETEGWEGVAEGLALLRRTLEQYWESVHPQLDPEDGNDPTERLNLLKLLFPSGGSYGGDPIQFINKLRESPLTDSRQLGRFSLRDIRNEEGPGTEQINGAFEDTPEEHLKAVEKVVQTAHEEVVKISEILKAKVGVEAPDSNDLTATLKEILSVLHEQMARRGMGSGEDGHDGGMPEDGAAWGGAGSASAIPNSSGEIHSRQDILLTLDRLCRYYDAHEPSSPVPLLLRGAKRLVSANYIEVAEYMNPEILQHPFFAKLLSVEDE